MPLLPVALAGIACALLVACSDDPVPVVDLDRVTLQGVGDDDAAWLARVVTGRLSDSRGFALLDASAPYVRVFDEQGNEMFRFLESGEGPGEATRPQTLAVLSTGRFVVGDGSRIQVFDAAGSYLSETVIAQSVVALDRGCDDELLVYGPGISADTLKREWLVAYPVTDSIEQRTAEVLLSDTARAAGRGMGKRVLASDGSTIALLDEYSNPARLVIFECGALEPAIVEMGWSPGALEGPRTLGPHQATFSGIALAKGTPVWLLGFMPTSPTAQPVQELYTVRQGEVARLARIRPAVALLHGARGQLLFSDLADLPGARLVDFGALRRAAQRAPTSSSPR